MLDSVKNSLFSFITYISGAFGLVITTQDIESIAGLICTILCITSMLVTMIINIINKFKNATSDGVITKEEKDEIIKEITDTTDKIKDLTNKDKKENKEDK